MTKQKAVVKTVRASVCQSIGKKSLCQVLKAEGCSRSSIVAIGVRPSQRIHSSMYRDLRTNLPRHIMSYTDFPFLPEAMNGASVDQRTYPTHIEVHF